MTSTDTIPISDLASTATTTVQTHTIPLPSPFSQTVPPPILQTQGAEAIVYKTTFLSPSTPAALKFRPSKPYRHPILDARLTKQRVLAEARVLVKLSALRREGITVPAVWGLEWDVARKVKGVGISGDTSVQVQAQRSDESAGASSGAGAWLLMEWIYGKSVKQLLRDWDSWYKAHGINASRDVVEKAEEDVKKLLRRVGKAIAVMHEKGAVIHGDLTSSNIMVRSTEEVAEARDGQGSGDQTISPNLDGEIVLIDFGLATQSIQEEDRAVDLYVLERAFGSTHPRQEGWFDQEVLQSPDGYKGTWKGASGILKKLEEVRMRGRKRTMIG